MRIGIIGAGMIGSTMARLLVQAGHEVKISSRHPEALRDLARSLGARASAGTPREAAAFGEVVLLAVPLKAVPGLAEDLGALLDGTIVLDTGNAYQGRDGTVAREAERHPRGSGGWAASLFPGARWVKALNTVYFKTLETEAHKTGDRLGIPLASDDHAAMDVAARLVSDAGFDPVVVGALLRGKDFEPGTRVYNSGMKGADVRRVLGVQ
jgi:predicted dinucleotide-binding enzyme